MNRFDHIRNFKSQISNHKFLPPAGQISNLQPQTNNPKPPTNNHQPTANNQPTILLALLLLLLPVFAQADDWPMFRNTPDFRGATDAELPDELPLKWSVDTGEPVKSSPVIVNGQVIIGSDNGTVYSLDIADGSETWTFKTEDLIESTALVLNDLVYIGSGDGNLYALDLATGKKKWAYKTDDQVLGAPGYTTEPGDPDAGENGGAPVTTILIGSYDFFLHGLTPGGKKKWAYETENYINGGPAIANNRIAFGGCDEKLHVVSALNGKPTAPVEVGNPVAGSPALEGDLAYFGHYGAEVVCANLKTGAIKWTYKKRDFPYFATPAVDDKRIIIGGRDKRVHCLDKTTGESLWEFRTGGRNDSSPIICGDHTAFGSDDGHIYVLNKQTGEETWKFEIGSEVISSPAFADETLVVGSLDGFIYAFGPK